MRAQAGAVPLPLLIGGKGDRMLGITARLADEWNMWSMPDIFAPRAEVIDRRCEDIGRDPGQDPAIDPGPVHLTDDARRCPPLRRAGAPRAAVAGTHRGLAEVVTGWRHAGVDEVIVPDVLSRQRGPRRDTLDAHHHRGRRRLPDLIARSDPVVPATIDALTRPTR